MPPHLILLTDSYPYINGAGISQTLFNLFGGYTGTITVMVREDENIPDADGRLHAQLQQYAAGPFKPISNRLGRWINPLLQNKQLAWQAANAICENCLPAKHNSLVIVSTTVPHKLHLAWCLLQKGYTVIPYFMDDWLANNTQQWKGGSMQQIAKEILAAAPAWLMISHNLQQTLKARYALPEKPCLVVHNPAPVTEFANNSLQLAGHDISRQLPTARQPARQVQSGGDDPIGSANCKLIYAGSIWPMHADALIAVADAIHLLQAQGLHEYALCIYAPPAHWKNHQNKLQGYGVSYCGWLPYADLPEKLEDAWLLLCTASFEAQHSAFSHSSVQTKLTDYMAAGKPTLFVGPPDAASALFVETCDSGFSISTPNPADIAERLQTIVRMPEQYLRKATNACKEASTTFSKDAVQRKLYAFLENVKQ